MSGTIKLTPEEQTTLTNALRLEQAGFVEAAKYLRGTILSLRAVAWDEEEPDTAPVHMDWAELFRRHRGSVPPSVPPTS